MTTWLKGACDCGTARGWIRVKIWEAARLSDDVGADDQKHAEYDEQDEGNRHVFDGGFVVLVRIHVLVPLQDFIKYYILPNLKPNCHHV